MLNNFVDVLTNRYVCFDGRANRREFWLFWLIIIIFQAAFFVLLSLIVEVTGMGAIYWIFASLLWLFLLSMLLPMLGLLVRRLHDIGKQGSWVFIAFVPIVGGIWLLVLIASKSQESVNQFG